jgi:hypothetical protein
MNHQVDRLADPRQALLGITLQFLVNGSVDPLSKIYFLEQAEAVLFLMQVANLEPVSMGMAEEWTGESPAQIRQAIVAYLEHACLSQHADHYRILGLLPQSSSDAIRQHYRQMIKLFHPDRSVVSDPAKAQAYAALINQAYAALNKKNAPLEASASHSASESRYTPRIARHGFSFAMRRHFVQAIFLFAMISLLTLYVMVNFNREPVLVSHAPGIPAVSLSSADHQLPAIALVDDNQLAPSTGGVLSKIGDWGKNFRLKELATPTLKQPLQSRDEPTETAAADSPKVVLSRIDHDSNSIPAQATPSVPQERVIQDANVQQAANVQQSEGLTAEVVKDLPLSTKPLTQAQLNALLIDFLDSYNQGNLDALMNLIGDDVKTAEATGLGKDGLKNAYSNLFSDTIKRQMILENPRWQMQGARAVGNMTFNADVQHKGNAMKSHFQGALSLEVTLVNQQPVITGLFVK